MDDMTSPLQQYYYYRHHRRRHHHHDCHQCWAK